MVQVRCCARVLLSTFDWYSFYLIEYVYHICRFRLIQTSNLRENNWQWDRMNNIKTRILIIQNVSYSIHRLIIQWPTVYWILMRAHFCCVGFSLAPQILICCDFWFWPLTPFFDPLPHHHIKVIACFIRVKCTCALTHRIHVAFISIHSVGCIRLFSRQPWNLDAFLYRLRLH